MPANNNGAVKDLTVGEPARLIFYFTLPLLAGNVFQQLFGFVDTLIVGRFLGVNALAAVGCTARRNDERLFNLYGTEFRREGF